MTANVTYRPLVDGGLLYDEEHGCIHHLNATAASIWEAWSETGDEDATVGRLCERYEVDADTARREVRAALARFAVGQAP